MRAVDHQETDRLPRNFGATAKVSEELQKLWGLDGPEFAARLRVDLTGAWLPIACPYEDGRNIWGMVYDKAELTSNVTQHPLAEVETVDEVDAYSWPDPDWADIEAFRTNAVAARETEKAVIGSTWGSVFGETYRLMGMDNFMMALVLNPEVVHRIVSHVLEFFLEVDRRAFAATEGLIDISYHGNDFGTQRGLLFSREMWVEFFKQPLTKLAMQAKSHGIRPMFHSCGAVSELIPEFVDCGVVILDPIQNTAEGMETERLKREFGAMMAFHGGVSAQKVLPLGTPEEVREHVRRICEIMKPGGGYIFTSDQAITEDTPAENVAAMYDAVEEFGWY